MTKHEMSSLREEIPDSECLLESNQPVGNTVEATERI